MLCKDSKEVTGRQTRGGRGKKLRLGWMDYVEMDCKNVSMRTRTLDRLEWASEVREAKVKLKGLLCQRTKSKKIQQ